MKTLIYQVYVGNRNKLYDFCTESVKAYAKRIGADYHVQRQPILMIRPDPFMTNRRGKTGGWEKLGYLPIFEKENAFTYLKSYDSIAIIDSDVYIRQSLNDSIFDEIGNNDFAAVLERDLPITPAHKKKIQNYSRMQYQSIRNVDWKWKDGIAAFFNMGIMVINKSIRDKYLNGETPQQFLRRPQFKAFIDGVGPWQWSTDQTLLNVWVKESGMKAHQLDWKWNALYTAIPDVRLPEAKFIHFYLKDKLPTAGENIEQLRKIIND